MLELINLTIVFVFKIHWLLLVAITSMSMVMFGLAPIFQDANFPENDDRGKLCLGLHPKESKPRMNKQGIILAFAFLYFFFAR